MGNRGSGGHEATPRGGKEDSMLGLWHNHDPRHPNLI